MQLTFLHLHVHSSLFCFSLSITNLLLFNWKKQTTNVFRSPQLLMKTIRHHTVSEKVSK